MKYGKSLRLKPNYGQLIFNKGFKSTVWKKSLFKNSAEKQNKTVLQHCWWRSTSKRMRLNIYTKLTQE